MKVAPAAADRFVDAPPAAIRAVLIYGPDTGLVQERAARLTRAVVDDPRDPFRVADIAAAALRDDPARLADEAAAMALTGGRRVVRIHDAGDPLGELLAGFLAAPPAGDTLVAVEAGNLGPRSPLRRAFEDAGHAAAIACYADEGRSLEAVIRETLAQNRIAVSPDAMTYLCANLGSDRLVSRSELEKLSLYMGAGGEVTLADAVSSVGDSAMMTLDDLAFAAGAGDVAGLPRLLDRVQQEGVAPVTVLRTVARHFLRLHLAGGLIAEGGSPDAAMKALRPPVFFKQADAFRAQLRRWPPARAEIALAAIGRAEISCKTTGLPAETVCQQALLRIAAMARRNAARG